MSKKEQSIRELLESQEYQDKKDALGHEVNQTGLLVDYSVFSKSPVERIKLKEAKWANLEERQHHYGVRDAHKYLNIPSRSIGAPIHITK